MEVLIIEDESRAANQLQNMLKVCSFEYTLLEILDTVEDAIVWFNKNKKPDLVFMDIQLADGLSFEIFQNTEIDAPIIFTTAFDQYAIQAFKVNSVDYLLKPIQQEDLEGALAKFTKSKNSNILSPNVIQQLLGSLQENTKREGLLVKEGSGFVQIKVEDFLYFYSQESITFGITTNKRYIIDESIDQLYSTLDNNQFFKINRGQLVSKRAILKINPYFNHRAKLAMTNPRDQEFIVSRPKTSDFKKWLDF
jgi:DNA-binding LytR/AlgR family response regulator